MIRILEKLLNKKRRGYNLDLWLPLKAGIDVAAERLELNKSLLKSNLRRSIFDSFVGKDKLELYELSNTQEEMNVEVESIDDERDQHGEIVE